MMSHLKSESLTATIISPARAPDHVSLDECRKKIVSYSNLRLTITELLSPCLPIAD